MQIRIAVPVKKELNISFKDSVEDLGQIQTDQAAWIDFEGYDSDTLKSVGERFAINPLALEDISTGKQRIKIEDYQDYLFAVSKGVITVRDSEFEYATEEIFMLVFEKLILSFHRTKSTIIEHVMDSLKNRIRTMKRDIPFASLVTHTIFDFSVDSFYSSLSDIENWLVSMRSDVIDFVSLKASDLSDVKDLMSLISRARREMSDLRIMLSQHRDVMSLAERGTLQYLSTNMMSDFRDIYDHTFQLIETVDSYMLRTSDVRDLYFTLRSAFTDNILRLLTIVATIFLPLTFLTGFYGMNFTTGGIYFQPGANSLYGFLVMVAVMVMIAAILLLIFRKRGWV